MRKLEPKLAQGFDVLDADHHHIEQQLYRIQTLLAALKQSEAANPTLADKLAQAIERAAARFTAIWPMKKIW